MDMIDLVTPERVVLKLRADDKQQLLAELARRAAQATGLGRPIIEAALVAREQLGSTGVGAGIAIPHARIAGLASFFGLFARLDRALDYDAIDGQKVDLVFLLLVPANATSEHLQALASVSRRLRDATCAAKLRKATIAAALYDILTKGPPNGAA
jgi:nitrogen PTS system EIIA component